MTPARRALVTGAGSGIGAACVDRLLAQGCRVAAVDLHAGDMAARAELDSPAAPAVNLRGHVTLVDDFVVRVRRITGFADLGVGTEPLPFAHALSPAGLAELLGDIEPTPLDDAIAETARILSASL